MIDIDRPTNFLGQCSGESEVMFWAIDLYKANPFNLVLPMSVLFANKLSTSFAYNEVGAVPDFGVGALVRNHSAGAVSQTSSATTRQTRRNIDRAEACFITKRPSYTHETVHWVNAVKKNPDLTVVCITVCKSRFRKFVCWCF